MCKVNEKTYVFPNGAEKLVETVSYCSKSDKKTLCNSYERIPQGPFFVHEPEPSLVHDDGFGTPASSAGQPSTPTSTAGMDYRLPGTVERRPSKSKRILDASRLKISFRKDGSKRDSHHSHHASASSSGGSSGYSAHSRQPSASSIPRTPPSADMAERVPSAAATTEGRRRRMRTVVDQDSPPNPPPGSSNRGSSLSGQASPSSDLRASRTFDEERRRAQDISDQQNRRRRREEKARVTDRAPESSRTRDVGISEQEAREAALDEQARREWERGNAREDIRRVNAERRMEEDRRRANAERRYTTPNRDASAGLPRRRSSAVDPGLVEHLRRSVYPAEATDEAVDEAENHRRRSTLQEQLRAGHAAQESPRSDSDSSDRLARDRRDRRSAHGDRGQYGAAYEAGYQPSSSARSPTSPTHRGPPMAYETRMPSYSGYTSDSGSNRHSWQRPDVSARTPMPPAPAAPQRRLSARRPSTSGGRPPTAMYGEIAQPGSSSGRNNAPWTQDAEAFRRHGERVLERARGTAARETRAQEASFRMSDVMYDGDGDEIIGYNYQPEDYYRRGY